MSSEPFLTLKDADKLIPSDVKAHVTEELSGSGKLTKKERKVLLYLLAHYENRTLDDESVVKAVVRNYYQLEESDDRAQKEAWRRCTWTEHPGKRMIQNIRSKLLKYTNSERSKRSDVLISIGGPREHYKVDISRQPKHSISPNQTSLVHCYDVGNDKRALKYEIDQMPHLWRLRDTHVRSGRGVQTYDKETLDEFEQGLKEFLSQAARNRLVLVVGQNVDDGYVKCIVDAAQGQEKKVVCHKIHQNSLMNFALLDYNDDRDSEVLFGWGRHGLKSKETVVRSSDPRLVNEFEEYYEALINSGSSQRLSNVRDLLSHPQNNFETTKITQWDQTRLYQLLDNEDTEVRMLTTSFMEWNEIRPRIVQLIDRGVHVKIVMMDIDNEALFKARFERLRFHPEENAERILRDQLEFFEKLCARQRHKGSIEVRRSSIMPFGFFVQSKNAILMGLMPPLSPYHQGPLIEVTSDSPLFKTLEKNWLGYWAYRSYSELAGLEEQSIVEQVWLATPDLSNDTGKRARFREAVKRNAARGVKYTVIFPKDVSLEKRSELETFRALFPSDKAIGRRLSLKEIALTDLEFRQLMPNGIHAHIVIFNPDHKSVSKADVYVEMLDEQLFEKMDSKEAQRILHQFRKVIDSN